MYFQLLRDSNQGTPTPTPTPKWINPSFNRSLQRNATVLTNSLPDLEEQPISLPCEDILSQNYQKDQSIKELTLAGIRANAELQSCRWKKTRVIREKDMVTERLNVCSNRVDLLIARMENMTQPRQAQQCPSRMPTRPCPRYRPPPPCTTPLPKKCDTCPTTTPCPSRTTTSCPRCPSPWTTPTPTPCPVSNTTPCPRCPSPTPCPSCPTCPTCPTARPCTTSPRVINVKQPQKEHKKPRLENATTTTPRTARELHHDAVSTWNPNENIRSTMGTTEPPHFNLYNLDEGRWYKDVAEGEIRFTQEGEMAGDIDYVHIVSDYNLKTYIDKGKTFCSGTFDKELQGLMSNSSKEVYQMLYRTLSHRCRKIVNQLHDTYNTFVTGTESHMYHRYPRTDPRTVREIQPDPFIGSYEDKDENPDEILHRQPRQFLIIGAALLALGIIGGGTYLFSKMAAASISVGSYTNPATITTLETHEKRLNVDERDISILKQTVQKLLEAENETREEVYELQLLHKVEELLSSLQWEFFSLSLGLEKLRHGRLSSLLVKPLYLQEILRNFRHQLKLLDIHTVVSDVNEIFKCETSYLVFKNETIRSITHIPVYKPSSLLKLFKFHSLPMRIHNKLMSFVPSTNYIAVNTDNTVYRPISTEDLTGCVELHKIKYCKDSNFFYRKNHASCIRSLFIGQTEAITKYCKVAFQPVKDAMVRLHNNAVILFQATKKSVTLTCKMGKPPTAELTFKGFKRITLFPGCRFKSTDFVADGATNLYVEPHEFQITVPDVREIQEFQRLQHFMNISGTELDQITSQQDLRIADINALFEKDSTERTLTITILGAIGATIGIILTCVCFFKCCVPCYKSLRKTKNKRSRSRPRYQQEEYEMEERQTQQPLRRSFRNPARTLNRLYPRS